MASPWRLHGACRRAPLALLAVLQLCVAGADEPCSKALGFNESTGPRDRSNQDLQFCPEHHKRTCCERNHTRQVLSTFTGFALDRSARCAKMSQHALCSLCDGDVGTGQKAQQNTVLLCPSFCARWYQSCVEDFFAPGGSAAGLQPCGPGSLVCSPLGEITEDPAVFCSSVTGFAVAEDENDGDACYDGVPAARSQGRAEKAPYSRPVPQRTEEPWWRKILKVASGHTRFSAIQEQLKAYVPGLVIGCVGMLFAWYLIRSD